MNRELRKSTREQRSKSVTKNSDKSENQSQTQLSEEQQDQRIQSSPAGQTRLSEVERPISPFRLVRFLKMIDQFCLFSPQIWKALIRDIVA